MANPQTPKQTVHAKNPPIARIDDGPITAKVWRNVNKDNVVFYNTTLSRVYTDRSTGKPAETQSFSPQDLLKLEKVVGDAYRAVQWNREQDRAQARETETQQQPAPSAQEQRMPSMADQRDAAMNAAASQVQTDRASAPQYEQPSIER